LFGKGKFTDEEDVEFFSFNFTKFPIQTKPHLLQKSYFKKDICCEFP